MTAQFGLNQGRVEDITMREDLSQNKVFSLNDFEEGNLGNMEFGMSNLEEPEVIIIIIIIVFLGHQREY